MGFFSVAESVAKLSTWSDKSSEQIGAVIVHKNEIISTGYNRNKGNQLHGLMAMKAGRPESYVAHAETSALMKLIKIYGWNRSLSQKKELANMKIFVFRKTSLGLGLARPCEICTAAIKFLGISSVYYTTDDGYAYENFI